MLGNNLIEGDQGQEERHWKRNEFWGPRFLSVLTPPGNEIPGVNVIYHTTVLIDHDYILHPQWHDCFTM